MNHVIKRIAAAGILAGAITLVRAQDTTNASPLTISGYAEVYGQYDFSNPKNNTRPAFVYSYNRNNEVALNLGFIKAAYNSQNVRANLAFGAGSYMNANYAAEKGVMKNIFEANIGVRLSRKADVWIDAGIFPSHIGFESAIGKDCWNLTRSMLADNSPYFETGVKIGYTTADGRWFLSALLLNGWQRIERPAGNSLPAAGTQVTYKPNAAITLNSSSFIGSDQPDSLRRMRYFHNFYGIFQLSTRCGLTAGFDIGAEQKTHGVAATSTWYSPVLIFRYATGNRTAIAARAEYYHDKDGVIISTGAPGGFATWGFSANFDYAIADHVTWRIEAKTLNSRNAIFEKRNSSFETDNTTFTTSIAISF